VSQGVVLFVRGAGSRDLYEVCSLTGLRASNTLAFRFVVAAPCVPPLPRVAPSRRQITIHRHKLAVRGRRQRRRIVAQAHISATRTTPSQEARSPQAYEEPGWTQSTCATPKKGTPQSHASLMDRGSAFRARAVCCAAPNTTRYIARDGGAPTGSSPHSFVRIISISAGSAGASKRAWEVQYSATAYGAGCGKL